MANGGWVKSLQCRSRAFQDVHVPTPRRSSSTNPAAAAASSSSCRSSSQAIRDVVVAADTTRHEHRKPKPDSPKSNIKTKTMPTSVPLIHTPVGFLYPALTELPEGHPSRKVVEIIFHTGWGPKPFSGRVDMIFKVQNGPRATARFEEYRELVKARAGQVSGSGTWEDDTRCAADGNEMMRFQCLGPWPVGGPGRGYPWPWGFLRQGKTAAMCTFARSGQANESTGGTGRRAMLVCRVIAGRVEKPVGGDPYVESRVGFDTVSGDNGKLLVYDSHASLPCFLIFYKL